MHGGGGEVASNFPKATQLVSDDEFWVETPIILA